MKSVEGVFGPDYFDRKNKDLNVINTKDIKDNKDNKDLSNKDINGDRSSGRRRSFATMMKEKEKETSFSGDFLYDFYDCKSSNNRNEYRNENKNKKIRNAIFEMKLIRNTRLNVKKETAATLIPITAIMVMVT